MICLSKICIEYVSEVDYDYENSFQSKIVGKEGATVVSNFSKKSSAISATYSINIFAAVYSLHYLLEHNF